MQLNYVMENYNIEDIVDIENFLTARSIEFQSLSNKIRIYFEDSGQVDVTFDKKICLTLNNKNIFCKDKYEVMKIINKL